MIAHIVNTLSIAVGLLSRCDPYLFVKDVRGLVRLPRKEDIARFCHLKGQIFAGDGRGLHSVAGFQDFLCAFTFLCAPNAFCIANVWACRGADLSVQVVHISQFCVQFRDYFLLFAM